MKTVKIKCGAYGHRAKGSSFVSIVARGESCIVDDEEAKRLVDLGVALIIGEVPNAEPAPVPVVEESVEDEQPEEEIDLSAMRFDELKKLAIEMGIYEGKLNSKAKLIDAIRAAEAEEAPIIAAEGLVE